MDIGVFINKTKQIGTNESDVVLAKSSAVVSTTVPNVNQGWGQGISPFNPNVELSPSDNNSTWLTNMGDVLSTGASKLGTSAMETASKIGEAFSDVKTTVKEQTDQNKQSLVSSRWIADKSQNDFFVIGKPCKFNQIVDPQQRFGNYLRSKMSVIDLIPVDYTMDFTRIANMMTNSSGNKTLTGSLYTTSYDEKITLYKRLCDHHGLKEYSGVRLYTTDDTTASDTIQVQYKDNTFQGMADKMTEFGQEYRNIANSFFGSSSKKFTDTLTGIGMRKTKELLKTVGATEGIQELLSGVMGIGSDILMKGNRMTFPKIWQSSSYNGNLSVNVRLISPYGHPKAIKEFIMKPLSYLILLSAPQTINGITYGGSIPITIKAYGLNYTIIGSIASITFRRGGSDSSFNLYRQPLTLDLSLEFQTLFDAFAVADPSVAEKGNKELTIDKNVFKDPNLSDPGALNLYSQENRNNLMTTLGVILTSFRPVKVTDMNINPQVYGTFVPPSRVDIPDGPSFIPLTGNLGSAISGAISNIGKFSNLITNAPKLIQQGLANVVYNTAKGTVSTIAGTASGWISKEPAKAANIANKLTGNFL